MQSSNQTKEIDDNSKFSCRQGECFPSQGTDIFNFPSRSIAPCGRFNGDKPLDYGGMGKVIPKSV